MALLTKIFGDSHLLYVDKRVRYFRYAGEVNTDCVLDVVRERILEGDIKKVVVASETGRSAIKAVDRLANLKVKIIVVTHYPAYTTGPKGEIPIGLKRPEYRSRLEYLLAHNCSIVQGTRPFAPPSRMIGWNYPTPETLLDRALDVIGPGFKISIEAALMATDAGEVDDGEDIISAAGTFKGLDTAIVATATYTMNFFKKFKVKEILAMPQCRVTTYPETEDKCWRGNINQYYEQ